jgi:hypothetical protein
VLANSNPDWLRVVGPDPARPTTDGLVCTVWVVDQNGDSEWVEKVIEIFDVCIQGKVIVNFLVMAPRRNSNRAACSRNVSIEGIAIPIGTTS